jgi:hypothetical protein
VLHAFSHRKSRLYRRYLGYREDPNERRITAEDEVTSLIMGPLAFLSPAAIGAFWLSVVRLRDPWHAFPSGPPTHAEMRFWPGNGDIEPDLCVELSWEQDTRILLVEFKWRAPLSGDFQLHNQWKDYLQPDDRERALHLFIGLDTSAAKNALSERDVWHGKLVMRSWFDILTALADFKNSPGHELFRWSEQVHTCLELLGVKRFNGFEALAPAPQMPLDGPLFFGQACSISQQGSPEVKQ